MFKFNLQELAINKKDKPGKTKSGGKDERILDQEMWLRVDEMTGKCEQQQKTTAVSLTGSGLSD